MNFNDDVANGKHGLDAQLFCDIPGCWNLVKKKKAADGRCFEHLDVVVDRSRSPVRRKSGVASASTHAPRMTEAIGKLRAGLEMMQKAINEIDGAATML